VDWYAAAANDDLQVMPSSIPCNSVKNMFTPPVTLKLIYRSCKESSWRLTRLSMTPT